MIGPRNRPPKSCRNGHLDRFSLQCNSRKGWRWRCLSCDRRGRKPYGAAAARTAARKEDILDLREFGYAELEIARKFGIKVESLWRFCYRHGLEVRK